MKKTTQIHIGGRHFYIDDDAFRKLNHYLDSLKRHFTSEGETGNEVVEDIEQRIAELLENKINNGKQAVNLDDVNETIRILGNVEDFVYEGTTDQGKSEYDYTNRRDYRKFYRDPEDYYIGGVASGMGQYFDIDPLWIRLAFVFLFFAKGAGLLIYLILWIVVPKARTTTEKLQMRGKPVTLSTIKDSVSEEYEKVRNSNTGERTRNAMENLMRAIGLVFVALFKFIIGFIGVVFLVMGSVFLAGLIMVVLGLTNVMGPLQFNGLDLPNITGFFSNSGYYYAAIISLVLLMLIPIAALIYGGVKILFDVKSKHPVLRAFLLTAWILALILFVTVIIVNVPNSPIEATGSKSAVIESEKYPTLVIDVRDNLQDKRITQYRILGLRFRYSEWDEALFDDVQLSIEPSEDNQLHLTVLTRIKNVDMQHSHEYIDEVEYRWEQKDSVLLLDKYFYTDDDDFWMFADVNLTLRIPKGKNIVFRQEACEILEPELHDLYCADNIPAGKKWLMSPEGALIEAK